MMKQNPESVTAINQMQARVEFTEADTRGIYKTIFNRRDVRGQFRPDPIPVDVLRYAAHHAPSVGYMQPWNFLVVKSDQVKRRVHAAFVEANEEATTMFADDKRELYSSLKLEGILESPINICITCDRKRTGTPVIGRTHDKAMDLYSSVCAVQNLWLAARAEGVGVGWVSILKQEELREALGIPEDIVPIAYLCVGYVSHFYKKPELETANWLSRMPLEELVYFDRWGQRGSEKEGLINQIILDKNFPGSQI